MWRPSASISILKKRAQALGKLRVFFDKLNVLEVDVPLLGRRTVSDPHLDSLHLAIDDDTYYLQTSPEYFMKRLLASGGPDMYYLGKAFRYDEVGRRHNPEFTMLEWYRRGFTDQQLMDEVIALIHAIKSGVEVSKLSYGDIFYRFTGINPYLCSAHELMCFAHETLNVDWMDDEKNIWLDLIFSHVIEPKMGPGITVIFDYPKEQAALAKISLNDAGIHVAKRFEVFIGGIELANGYWELTDVEEQKARFERDNVTRRMMNKPEISLDQSLLSAMHSGLPECSGVALGIDRLLMGLFDCSNIQDVQTFPFNRL